MRGDLTLGWPPVTTNHLYVRRRSGVHLASRAAAWRDEVILVVRQSGVRVPPDGELAVTIAVHPPKGSRVDLDNLAKLTLDAVFAGLETDDRRIADLRIRRAPWADPPYLTVEIREAIDVSSH